jgi:hypothetical protein
MASPSIGSAVRAYNWVENRCVSDFFYLDGRKSAIYLQLWWQSSCRHLTSCHYHDSWGFSSGCSTCHSAQLSIGFTVHNSWDNDSNELKCSSGIQHPPITLDMLCQICQHIKFEPLASFQERFAISELPTASSIKVTRRGPFYYPHQASREDLRLSGNSGCHFCAQIWYSYGGLEASVPDASRFWLDCRLFGDESVPRAIRVSCGGPVPYGYVGQAFLDVMLPGWYTPPWLEIRCWMYRGYTTATHNHWSLDWH